MSPGLFGPGLVRHVAAALVGGAGSLAALTVHRSGLPWLVLAVAGSLLPLWALRGTSRPRTAASYALGWLLVFGIAFSGRPEGDYVLASDVAGYTLIVTSLGMIAVGVAALLPSSRGPVS